MNRKQMEKKITKYISELETLGLNVNKVTQGKTVKQLAHSSVTYNNFMKRRNREIERPKIVAESKAYDEKRQAKKLAEFNRNRITKETLNIAKFNENIGTNEKQIYLKTQTVAKEFFYRYFKELTLNEKDIKEINKLIKRFGNRLDLIYDLMDNNALLEFKYPFMKELLKKGLDDELVLVYHEHMRERLHEMSKGIQINYGI